MRNRLYPNAYQSAQKSTIFSVILINVLQYFFLKYGIVFKIDMNVLNVEGGYGLRVGYNFLVQSFAILQKMNFIEFPMNFQYRH